MIIYYLVILYSVIYINNNSVIGWDSVWRMSLYHKTIIMLTIIDARTIKTILRENRFNLQKNDGDLWSTLFAVIRFLYKFFASFRKILITTEKFQARMLYLPIYRRCLAYGNVYFPLGLKYRVNVVIHD